MYLVTAAFGLFGQMQLGVFGRAVFGQLGQMRAWCIWSPRHLVYLVKSRHLVSLVKCVLGLFGAKQVFGPFGRRCVIWSIVSTKYTKYRLVRWAAALRNSCRKTQVQEGRRCPVVGARCARVRPRRDGCAVAHVCPLLLHVVLLYCACGAFNLLSKEEELRGAVWVLRASAGAGVLGCTLSLTQRG